MWHKCATAGEWRKLYGKAQNRTELAVSEQGISRACEEDIDGKGLSIRAGVHSCGLRSRDALPAARVRARLRYDKLIRAAAKEISNKNRDTLRGMLADE